MGRRHIKHESLQDRDTIRSYLEKITEGLENGVIRFSNGDDSIELEPDGLLRLQVNALRSGEENQLDVTISWAGNSETPTEHKELVIE